MGDATLIPLRRPGTTCVANDAAPALPLDVNKLQQRLVNVTTRFISSALQGDADRGSLGAETLRLMRRQRSVLPAKGEDAMTQLKNLLCVSSMCGLHRAALGYAKELHKLPACAKDIGCHCTQGGRIVSLLRLTNATAADVFFRRRLAPRCPYTSSWQMPTPPSGFDRRLSAQPFWDSDRFSLGRLLREHRASLLRELRPFARRRRTLWATDEASVAYELVEAGSWRQLTLFQTASGWNATVCAHLRTVCSVLQGFAATDAGRRELGGKIKLFELGRGASLVPHFGQTNTRLFLHMSVLLPSAGSGGGDRSEGAWLRVGQTTHRWSDPGEVRVFDDSFEHSVLNDGEGVRVVLGVELVHPELQEAG